MCVKDFGEECHNPQMKFFVSCLKLQLKSVTSDTWICDDVQHTVISALLHLGTCTPCLGLEYSFPSGTAEILIFYSPTHDMHAWKHDALLDGTDNALRECQIDYLFRSAFIYFFYRFLKKLGEMQKLGEIFYSHFVKKTDSAWNPQTVICKIQIFFSAIS